MSTSDLNAIRESYCAVSLHDGCLRSDIIQAIENERPETGADIMVSERRQAFSDAMNRAIAIVSELGEEGR